MPSMEAKAAVRASFALDIRPGRIVLRAAVRAQLGCTT